MDANLGRSPIRCSRIRRTAYHIICGSVSLGLRRQEVAPCNAARRSRPSLHFAHYNFVRVHMTLRVAPAMEARVSDRLWSLDELVGRTSAWRGKMDWTVELHPDDAAAAQKMYLPHFYASAARL